MLFSDSYKEIMSEAKANLRERGSKFLAFVFPVRSEEEIKIKLHELRVFYPDATHHCYAFVLNPDKSAQRANDDGEPSGSAGRPILRAIMSADVTNVLVVVVRYFGGTQLGIPGLIQAYGEAAKMAMEAAKFEEKFVEDVFVIATNFEFEQEIHRLISKYNVRIMDRQYDTKVAYTLAVRASQAQAFVKQAKDNYHLEVERKID